MKTVGFSRFLLSGVLVMALSSMVSAQALIFQDPKSQALLGTAYESALRNLREINTIADAQRQYNRTGLFADPPGTFIRAGGNYATPWTRDAAINCWNAASLLEPAVAKNTLWAVCERQENHRLIVQRDNQWWDKVIWIQGAWSHFAITGDREFLALAYEAARETLDEMVRTHYNGDYGLFEGPSVLCDGIAGYPEPPHDPKVASSFILDHPGGDKLMSLSTNCVHYQANCCAAWMAEQLGRPDGEIRPYRDAAARLKAAINGHLWMPDKATYAYFIHGSGPLAGELDRSQEGMGLAYAILFGVAEPEQIREILRTVHLEPEGIVCVWPHFARFSDEHPGRHNVAVWPLASGMWAHAAAKAGAIELFQREMQNTAAMANDSQGIFYEIYHSTKGIPDGGWQTGRHWDSCVHQTWSATAYLRMVFCGLFGMDFQPDGLRLTPSLPSDWRDVQMAGLKYREMTLDIKLTGHGNRIAEFMLDGQCVKSPVVPPQLTGKHTVAIRLAEPE